MNSLPLYEIISEPLIATAHAQTELNEATKNFINSLTEDIIERPSSINEAEKQRLLSQLNTRSLDESETNIVQKWTSLDLSQDIVGLLERLSIAPWKSTKKFTNLTFQYGNDGSGNLLILTVPMISIVNIPSIRIKTAEINFNMEVLEQTTSSNDGRGKLVGRLSSSNKTTRETSISQDYQFKIKASDDGPPEGLARILDILNDRVS